MSEYGIAATRGKTDQQVIDAMVSIADAEFQSRLIGDAKRAGKLDVQYQIRSDAIHNTPATVQSVFERDDVRSHFPSYPLGTELTPTEQELVEALEWLKRKTARRWSSIGTMATAVFRGGRSNNSAALARMALDRPSSLSDRVTRRLLNLALEKTKK